MTFCYHTLQPLTTRVGRTSPSNMQGIQQSEGLSCPLSGKSFAMLIWLAKLPSQDDPFHFFTLSSVAGYCAIDDSPDCRRNGNFLMGLCLINS
jgi:hypothetical protein